MTSIKVDISPAIIDWVMQHTSTEKMTEQVLDELSKWKDGQKTPTFNKIESISKTTQIPLGYFFLKTPPQENFPILQYRTIDSVEATKPSRNLVDTIRHMESVQEWMRDYLVNLDNDSLSFVGSLNNTSNIISLTNTIRHDLDIKIDWFSDAANTNAAFKILRKQLEKIGILIMMSGIVGKNTHRSLDIQEFRAFTLIDSYAPLIFINSNDSQSGKLFSLMHEAAHIWIGEDSFYNDRSGYADSVNPVETVCNAVAAELLVPNLLFTHKWNSYVQNNTSTTVINKLSSYFKCGSTIVARRALDNRFISRTEYQVIAEEGIKAFNDFHKNKIQSGGDFYATTASRLDNRFLMAVDSSVKEGKTLFTDAYRLTNTSRKTFSNLIEKIRGDG